MTIGFHKPKRKIDEALLARVREQPCAACGEPPPSDPSHIKTVKSGGHDIWWNVIPLDRVCHSAQHKMGFFELMRLKPMLEKHLSELGWNVVVESYGRKRLIHPLQTE